MKNKASLLLLVVLFLGGNLNADINYKKGNCSIPDILLETILITENANKYPFYIRTNTDSTLNKFDTIANKYPHKKTKDKMLIDCLSKENCITIAGDLIKNKVSNLDLGLFQINYLNYPDKLEKYFSSNSSYQKACSVVIDKIRIKKRWDWDVFAGYHSFTKEFNDRYKKKLKDNFESLLLAKNFSSKEKIPNVSVNEIIEKGDAGLVLNTVIAKKGLLKREVEYFSLIKD